MSFRANIAAAAVELPGAYAYELVSLCTRWGVAPEALLDGTGLTAAILKDPATRLPLTACATVVERARELTGQPALAFAMGLHMRLSWHGFLGFAAMTSGTVREALEIAQRFIRTRTTAFELSTYVEGAAASLVLEERASLGPLREFTVIMLLVGIGQIAKDVTGQALLTGVAECAFPEPEYAAPVLSRAGDLGAGTMRFDRPAHRLLFDASILDLPVVTSDPAAMELARAQCDRELATQAAAAAEGTFLGGVRRAMTPRSGDGFRSLDDVARRLHVSTRTLKRRLAEEGASFSGMLEEVRRQRALLLLEDRRLAVEEVAARLGYSDAANFTRAFRRWTGETPAAYRVAPDRDPSPRPSPSPVSSPPRR
ncbi:MAG TPA: AraC family transcriptional regulator [Polyangiaceae bacterium]